MSKLLHPIGLGKRVLAFLIDLGMTLGVGVLLYATLGTQVIIGKSNYYALRDTFRESCVSSHLAYEYECETCKSYFDPSFVTKSGDNYVDPEGHTLIKSEDPISFTMKDGEGAWLDNVKLNGVEMHPYELYEKIVWSYFTDFLPNDPAFAGKTVEGKTYAEYYTPAYVVKEIYGIKADVDGNPILDDSMFYEPAKDSSDHWDYAAQPVIRGDKFNITDKAVRDAVATFFNSSNDGVYVKALTDLKGQYIYTEPAGKMNMIAYWALLPSVVIPALTFFFIIPLCLKDGKTLGKLFLKMAVVGIDGYKAPIMSKIIHYFFVFLGFELLLIPYTTVAFMIMMFYFAGGYMILVMSKTNQAVHDKLAKTVVVDVKSSVWFEDEAAKEAYIASNPDSDAAKAETTEKEKTAENGEIKRVMVADSMPSVEETGVLDLDTIAKFHRDTANITSFDEFEAKSTTEVVDMSTLEKGKDENK